MPWLVSLIPKATAAVLLFCRAAREILDDVVDVRFYVSAVGVCTLCVQENAYLKM